MSDFIEWLRGPERSAARIQKKIAQVRLKQTVLPGRGGAVYFKVITTISGGVPVRMGGPQVPTPLDV